jgi:hypothetical protein
MMTDFSWTQQHAQIQSRTKVEAAFEQLGFQFTQTPAVGERPQRPRTIGISPDGRVRIELIGPDDVVFKATLLADLDEQGCTPPHLHAHLTHFVQTLAPTWAAGPSWITTQLATPDPQTTATVRSDELLFELRLARCGTQMVLGVTWQPST